MVFIKLRNNEGERYVFEDDDPRFESIPSVSLSNYLTTFRESLKISIENLI